MAAKGWWEKLLEDKQSQVDETMDDDERKKAEEEKARMEMEAERKRSDEGFLMKTLRSFTSRSKR